MQRLGSKADVEDVKAHPFFKDLSWEKLLKKEIEVAYKPKVKSNDDSSNFVYATGGVMLQVGRFGAGLLADALTFRLTDAKGEQTAIVVGRQRALVAVNVIRGQLNIGGGVRSVTTGFDPVGEDIFYTACAD